MDEVVRILGILYLRDVFFACLCLDGTVFLGRVGDPSTKSFKVITSKLDGVGPVDNRPSTD